MKLYVGLFAFFAVICGAMVYAQGATFTFTFSFTSPVSTSVAFTPTGPCSGSGSTITCTLPLAAGTQLGTITVAPAGWTGGLTTSSSLFAIGGTTPNYTLNVGTTAITTAQSVTETITSTP